MEANRMKSKCPTSAILGPPNVLDNDKLRHMRFQFELWRVFLCVACISIFLAIMRLVLLGSNAWFPLAIAAGAVAMAGVGILLGKNRR
jgi:hypothetical protein